MLAWMGGKQRLVAKQKGTKKKRGGRSLGPAAPRQHQGGAERGKPAEELQHRGLPPAPHPPPPKRPRTGGRSLDLEALEMPANWVHTGQDNCGTSEAEQVHPEGSAVQRAAEQLQQELGGSGSAAASKS